MEPQDTDRLIHDDQGLNTGSWPIITAGGLVTPLDRFFTRSHAAVPAVDPESWRLEVTGLVHRPASLSLSEIVSRFPRRAVAATLICAGMRREELVSVADLGGELPWGVEAAGTAEWAGVALADVLQAAGVSAAARFVEFTGLDRVERHGERFGFGGSIDLEKALGGETLLATEMNGRPLRPAHGFPLRAVVPGWIGARSVKWLGRITLRESPSGNYFQTRAYRVQREVAGGDPRDVTRGEAMSAVPLNSVIVEPRSGREAASPVLVQGWAIGAECRQLERVEVSPDGGRTWVPAVLSNPETGWTWTHWQVELPLPAGAHVLAVRAADVGGNIQPSDLREAWNAKGYGNNAWHRVPVLVR